MKKKLLLIITTILICMCITGTALAAPKDSPVKRNITPLQGTVNVARLNFRTGASTDYPIISVLTYGTMVDVLVGTQNGWYQIKYNNTIGYVFAQYITMVVPETYEDTSWQSWAQSSTTNYNWGEIELGGGNTFANYGCAIISWGKICIQKHLIDAQNFTPPVMVERLRNLSPSGLSSNGSIYFSRAANVFENLEYIGRPRFNIIGETATINNDNLADNYTHSNIRNEIIQYLNDGYSLLLHVRTPDRPTPHHWVAVDKNRSISNNDIFIFDSLYMTRNGERVEHYLNVGHTVSERYIQISEMIVYR